GVRELPSDSATSDVHESIDVVGEDLDAAVRHRHRDLLAGRIETDIEDRRRVRVNRVEVLAVEKVPYRDAPAAPGRHEERPLPIDRQRRHARDVGTAGRRDVAFDVVERQLPARVADHDDLAVKGQRRSVWRD
ncbi:MAG: hypothetical protein GWO04_10115, partial [Actinobacteria bacterium]|nr:hypothetical protein [Actinomycetota bacterium]